MKKIKKAWKVFDEHFILVITFLTALNMWFEPNFWVVIWFIYMGYSFYELLAEFVKNHRTSVGIQIKEYIEKRNLVEEEGESEE